MISSGATPLVAQAMAPPVAPAKTPSKTPAQTPSSYPVATPIKTPVKTLATRSPGLDVCQRIPRAGIGEILTLNAIPATTPGATPKRIPATTRPRPRM